MGFPLGHLASFLSCNSTFFLVYRFLPFHLVAIGLVTVYQSRQPSIKWHILFNKEEILS